MKTSRPDGQNKPRTLDEDEERRAYSSMEKNLQAIFTQDFGNWGEERAENRSDLLYDLLVLLLTIVIN